MGASMRYLSQRFTMPNRKAMGILNDIGTEELAHLEMVATIIHQLTRGLSPEEIQKAGFAPYYVDHTIGIWPQAAGGIPFNACEFQSKELISTLFFTVFGIENWKWLSCIWAIIPLAVSYTHLIISPSSTSKTFSQQLHII